MRRKQPLPEPSKPEPYGLEPEQLETRGAAKRAHLLNAIAQGQFKPVGVKGGTDEDDTYDEAEAMDVVKVDPAVQYISFALDDGRAARYERFVDIDVYARKPLAGNRIRARQDAAFASRCRTVPKFANESERDQYLATRSGLLRNISKDYVYIAGDKNDQVLVYLDPIGIPFAFGNRVKRRLEAETIEFFAMKRPTPPKDVDNRHQSHPAHLKRNHYSPDQCGVDHIGILHKTGDPYKPPTLTREWDKLSHTKKQLYYYYFRDTVSIMTKLLEFEFGVLDPTMRQEHRDVYDNSGEYLKLPPIHRTYTYQAIVVNMQTDLHHDRSDWDRGLTGICQLGQFKDAAMVLKDLGIVLDGYQSGATLHFRGNIFEHYTTAWTGKCRYAFDHTCKQSVRAQVQADVAKRALQPAVAKASEHETDSEVPEEDSDASEEEWSVSEDEPAAAASNEEPDVGQKPEWIIRFLRSRIASRLLRTQR